MKRISTILMLIIIILSMNACANKASPNDPIVQEISFAKNILIEGTKERVLERIKGAKENNEKVVVEATLAGVEGYYDLCLDNETAEIEWIIFRYNSDFDVQKAVKNINGYLGKYDEYDSEFECYTWDNEELELNISLYAEKGTWIYPNFEYKDALYERCLVNGHKNTKWSAWDTDYNNLVMVKEKLCLDCEQIIDKETVDVTDFIENDIFTIHAAGFADRFDKQSARLNGIEYYSESEYKNNDSFYDEDNTVFYRIQDKKNNYNEIGICSFNKTKGKLVARMDEYEENIISCINILISDYSEVTAVIYSSILAIDPNIEYSEAADVGQKIVDNIILGEIDESNFKGIDYNNINYVLYRDHEYYYLIIKPTEK